MDIQKIHNIFDTMSYGESLEDTSIGNQWLKKTQIGDVAESSEVNDILRKCGAYDYVPQKSSLIRFCQELEKSANIISQIEILSRGVLSKDTRKAVDILVQYIYYYASLVDGNASGVVVTGIFENDHPLWILGLFLGPALASGHQIVLKASTKFAVVVTYVFELAIKAGIPKQSLILVSSNNCDLEPYLNIGRVVSLFVDLLNEKYQETIIEMYPFQKRLILSAYKTSMLVFDSADLDSAVESVVESAWGYQGMLPWSIDTIIVQENVFNMFTEKLKNKLKYVRIGNGDDKLADIAYPSNPDVFQQLKRTVDKAKALGIEIFQKEGTFDNFTPTLIIGSRTNTNNVLTGPVNDGTVTLLAFRSIDEGVNLANNSRQGLGASVWSENIGLVNEVARKLQVANVWVNSHGLFSPHLPLVPIKDSGLGYFGGKQGLVGYYISQEDSTSKYKMINGNNKILEEVNNAINASKSASTNWGNASVQYRMKTFLQLSVFLEENQTRLVEKLPVPPVEWLNNFRSHLGSVVFESNELGGSTQNGYSVTSLKRPRGVLAMEMGKLFDTGDNYNKLLLAALFEGNTVVLLNGWPEIQEFCQELSKRLPAGVLTILPYSSEAKEAILKHKELNGYFCFESTEPRKMPLADLKQITRLPFTLGWKETFNYVTVFKHIWSNIGQSSQCSF